MSTELSHPIFLTHTLCPACKAPWLWSMNTQDPDPALRWKVECSKCGAVAVARGVSMAIETLRKEHEERA